MVCRLPLVRSFLCASCLSASTVFGGGYGFDVVTSPAAHAAHLEEAGLTGAQGTWMRVRGLVDNHRVKASDTRTVESDRAGLQALRDRGIKTAVILRWSPGSWIHGVREGGGHRMPLDLREAYERGRWLALTYGDLVDVWEIDNEPDISFCLENPETYAAFLKAVYLGLTTGTTTKRPDAGAGFPTTQASGLGSESSGLQGPGWLERKRGMMLSSGPLSGAGALVRPVSRVIMAPLALPPGPYLERLWANGIASHTDGFNFHYYGYAEDFTGVYRQFEDAVTELGATGKADAASLRARLHRGKRGRMPRPLSEPFPVFITEYGYGLLDAASRDTVEGRVRQWRWFADVMGQVRALRPEGPMAFLFNPYYEANLNEFGLTLREPLALKAGAEGSPQSDDSLDGFRPSDFGSRRVQPWMRNIGKAVGEVHASPALAYMWDFAERHPYRPRAWRMNAPPPSPVVVDFIAGTDMVQDKSAGGYRVQGASVEWTPEPVRLGRARWVLYNFSARVVTGRLEVAEPSPVTPSGDTVVTLAPGERREIPIEVSIMGGSWTRHPLRVRFVPRTKGIPPAVFASALYPATYGMTATSVTSFDFPEDPRRQAELAARAVAVGEPRLQADGRWLVTDGVAVEERADGVWRFRIDYLPAEPLRPAMAALPLPQGFTFESGAMLNLERRKADVVGRDVEAGVVEQRKRADGDDDGSAAEKVDPARLISRAGKAGDMMDVYFRTENGNLYQTWPRLRVTTRWETYQESADNFTMGFFGRAALPWRFAENTPVALVFFLRPAEVPAIFEVRDARIVRLK